MSATDPAAKKSRYLLTDWNPNDESKWDSKLAWRTLWITTYSLILAFCVWFLPSAIAPKLKLLGFPGSSELSVGDRVLVGGCG